jgi:hypothetical protein
VLQGMREERHNQHVDMRNSMNVSDKLAQFLKSQQGFHTIYTNRIHIGSGRPTPGTIKVLRDTGRLQGVNVHIGLDDKRMRISSTALSTWLSEVKYSRHVFTNALKREFGARDVKGRLGSGTNYPSATEHLIEIDLAGTPLLNFIDEA